MLKKDSTIVGLGIGLACPLILFGLLYLVKIITGHMALDKAMFVCVALNVIPIRYYFISAKMDRTGRGILAMTVLLIITVTMITI